MKFHHYCFARKVSIITDNKPLVAILKRHGNTVTETTQNSAKIHQYIVIIIYKPGPDLFIADWLSRQNHKESKDAEISGMQLNIDAKQTTTSFQDCMIIQELQQVTSQNEQVKQHIIKGWLENKDQIPQDILDVLR